MKRDVTIAGSTVDGSKKKLLKELFPPQQPVVSRMAHWDEFTVCSKSSLETTNIALASRQWLKKKRVRMSNAALVHTRSDPKFTS